MKISYNVASGQSSYVTEKTPQPPTKPFVIPTEEVAGEKTTTQNASANNYDPFKAAETGSVTLPSWINTKTEPRRSDEEILKEIEKLAKEHAKTGQFQDSDPRFKALMDEYVSSVSPDRGSILANSTKEISERIASELAELVAKLAEMAEIEAEEEEKRKNELLDYLMDAIAPKKGKKKNDIDIISSFIATRGNNIAAGGNSIIASRNGGDYTAVNVDQGNKMPWMMKSDMYNANVTNGVVTSAFFYDEKGNMVMHYDDKGGLRQEETNEEHKKRKELQAVYNAVYDFSVGRYNPHDRPRIGTKTNNIMTSVNGIEDARPLIKEVYDRTYDRLRSEIANSVA